MKKYNTPFAPAIKHVRSCRPNICPNLGFELQLKHYQEVLTEKEKEKEKPSKQEQPEGRGKQCLEAKQMLLTFNAPSQPKAPRMASTHTKAFGTHTPNPTRKGLGYSSSKRASKAEGDFLVVGHQPEGAREGASRSRVWGVRAHNNLSFKF
jgi:hypothetical protein